jgi:hypothetical protein
VPKIPRINAIDPRDLPPALATRANADIMLMRLLVNFLDAWKNCGPRCRRARCCTDPTAACFDLNAERIRAIFEAIADWPRFDGPRDPEDAAGPIGDLFD